MSDQSAVEALANYAHEAWSGWMLYLWSKTSLDAQGQRTIPAEWVRRWERQMHTPYADLREDEQESDRAEARKMLTIAASSTPAPVASPSPLERQFEELIVWALGEHPHDEFPGLPEDWPRRKFYWRSELRQRYEAIKEAALAGAGVSPKAE